VVIAPPVGFYRQPPEKHATHCWLVPGTPVQVRPGSGSHPAVEV